MRLLHEFSCWVTEERVDDDEYALGDYLRHFVAISSNSAVIPRTNSAAYCASKAALSQGLRVKAREARGGDYGYVVYGYEPGLLAGTPMTWATEKQFPDMPLHRIRGEAMAAGVPCAALAAQIVAGLQVPGAALNGATIRYDGGEL
jgi:NAD(P)-dependent dehydrogenase (short-subunit alcohol dehydrogenase family)